MADSYLSCTILRPTVIFGLEDILINNIAWFVRHLPVFGIPGDGTSVSGQFTWKTSHCPIVDAVDDHQNSIINAVGPETYTFEGLVQLIAGSVRRWSD